MTTNVTNAALELNYVIDTCTQFISDARPATDYVAELVAKRERGCTGRECSGRVIAFKPMAKRLRLYLSTGDVVTWALAQGTIDGFARITTIHRAK